MEKDEISMSWNKKVSLKEIAQFYENKLRELDAKQNLLNQEIDKALQKIEQKTQDLENSIENIKRFVDKLNETQKSIENLRDEINKKDKILDERIGFFDQNVGIIIGKIDILQNALKEFITFQIIKNEQLNFSVEFIMGAILPKDIEQIENFMRYIKMTQIEFSKENIKDTKVMEDLENSIKVYFETFNNISLIIHPEEQYYKLLSLYIIKFYQEFLSRHERILRDFFNINEDNRVVKDENIYNFYKYNLLNDYFSNIDIKKNKNKDEKENIK